MPLKPISCGICWILFPLWIARVSASDGLNHNGIGVSVSMPTAVPDNDDDGWASFVDRYGKNYINQTEASQRRALRWRNLGLIREHNAAVAAEGRGFTLKENNFTDWTEDEYRQLLGFKSRRTARTTTTSNQRARRHIVFPPYMPTYYNTVDVGTLPSYVNWTADGWVGDVMNQGQCGSCWSYSATGSIQSQYYNFSGRMVQLSQQNLIDCSMSEGNEGCDGGNMIDAFWYVQTNGIESLAAYPDVSDLTGSSYQQCAYNASLSVTSITSWRYINPGSESALQQAVALVGPVSVAIDASSASFQLYGGGVYNSSSCGSSDSDLDHAVLAVGYGTYNGQPYWLLQNSWGTSWGINGYMMMARNDNNMCGIATDASFPVVSQTSSPAAGVNTNGENAASAANSFHDLPAFTSFTMLLCAIIRHVPGVWREKIYETERLPLSTSVTALMQQKNCG